MVTDTHTHTYTYVTELERPVVAQTARQKSKSGVESDVTVGLKKKKKTFRLKTYRFRIEKWPPPYQRTASFMIVHIARVGFITGDTTLKGNG